MKSLILILTLALIPQISKADLSDSMSKMLTFNIGMINTSFTENPDTLETTDGSIGNDGVPESGSGSSIALDVMYEKFFTMQMSYFGRLGGTIFGSTNDRYYTLNGGVNYYFDPVGTSAQISGPTADIYIAPSFRYYVGGHLGGSYLVYNTPSKTKGDFLVELGGQAGAIYAYSEKISLRGELGFSRSLGTLVSSTEIKLFAGVVYLLGNK